MVGLEAEPKQTQGHTCGLKADMADKVWADSRRTHSGRRKADTQRLRFGEAAKANSRRTHGGHMADKL